jgi:hypothetical protein
VQALRELADRANRGGEQALANLRQLLDQCPEVWQHVGDLARRAELAWLGLLAGEDQLSSDSIKRKVAQLKADLAGPAPTPLESMLIDLVAVCWLGAMHGEIAAADAGGSVALGRFREGRAEGSQKRLLRAVKTLAAVRAVTPRGLVPSSSLVMFAPAKETA